MGHLGRAPQLQSSKSGNPYTRLNLCTNRYLPKEDGGFEEKAEWHSVFVWGDQATKCAEYLRTGALVFVEGSLTYWQVAQERSDEKTAYKNAIHADRVRFISYGKEAEEPIDLENLDNPQVTRNHNAVAHPVM
jgi:single-strand DNA-binding protein